MFHVKQFNDIAETVEMFHVKQSFESWGKLLKMR